VQWWAKGLQEKQECRKRHESPLGENVSPAKRSEGAKAPLRDLLHGRALNAAFFHEGYKTRAKRHNRPYKAICAFLTGWQRPTDHQYDEKKDT